MEGISVDGRNGKLIQSVAEMIVRVQRHRDDRNRICAESTPKFRITSMRGFQTAQNEFLSVFG